MHKRTIHAHAGVHNLWIEAHNVDNVPDPPGARDGCIKLLFEEASRLFNGDLLDPGHWVFGFLAVVVKKGSWN
jgi:hypothetical protein